MSPPFVARYSGVWPNVLLVAIVLLVALPTAPVLAGKASGPSTAPGPGALSPAVAPVPSSLAGAEASLATGAGPAANTPATCSGSPEGGVACAPVASALTVHPQGSSNVTTWTSFASTTTKVHPGARYLGSMVYDWGDGYVLLFGGYQSDAAIMADTWTFQNGVWKNITTSAGIPPPARYVAMMSYDFADHYVLLFGGNSGSVVYNDTWSFSGGSWTQIFPTVSPPARWRAAMSWDGADNYTVLFGGTDETASTYFSDTWTYVAGEWTDRTSTAHGAPPATYRVSATWDPRDGYVLLFGGCTTSTCPTDATYSYVHGNWTDLSSTDGTPPAARIYTEFTWDNATDSVVLFGGSTGTSGPVVADTWLFYNGTWYQDTKNLTRSPAARGYAGLAYDPVGNYLLLFGGYDGSATYYGDTWALGPAVLVSITAAPAALDIGQSTVFNVTAFSANQPLTYAYSGLPAGCISGNFSSLNCTPTANGLFQVGVNVSDPKGNVTNASVLFEVDGDPAVGAFNASPDPVTAGETTTLHVDVIGGGYPLHFQYSSLPSGCSSQNTASLPCRPNSAGTYHPHVIVTDSRGFGVQGNTTLVVNVRGVVVTFLATPAIVDIHVLTTLTVTMQNGTAPFSYAYSGLPAGCLSANLSALPCTPEATGSFTVNVNVTDLSGYRTSSSLVLIVDPPVALGSVTVSPQIVDVGQTVTITDRASGGTGGYVYTYGGLPPGCTPGIASPAHCVPTGSGTFNISATATDSVGGSSTNWTLLTVAPDPTVASLTASPAAIDVRQSFSLSTNVTGGVGPFKFEFTGLPPSCTSTESANISCTPADSGTLQVSVTVTDSLGKKNTSSVLTVMVDPDPTVSGHTLNPSPAIVNSQATLTLQVSGGSGVYTFRYSGLPPGCQSRNSSTLTCIPTATGDYQVSVTVTDSFNYPSGTQVYFNVTPSSSSGLGNATLYIAIGVVVVIAAVAAVFVLRRRRKQAEQYETPAVFGEIPP
jgi:hypothetical protein